MVLMLKKIVLYSIVFCVCAAGVFGAEIIRIKAGASAPFKDSAGNTWAAETGIEGGSTVEKDASTVIGNTKDAGLFLSEHYSMESFSQKLPNGKYTVRLYFAETFDQITGPGQRVFHFKVQDKEIKNFDVFVKAGGSFKAYVETVPVEVSNGELKITFTSEMENPEINAIEIIPDGMTAPVLVTASAAAPVAAAPAQQPAAAPSPAQSGPAVLKIDAGKAKAPVSPMLYGFMTEEINFAYEGGLYGELIRNRSFKADAVVPRVYPSNYVVGKYLPVTFRPNTKPRYWAAVGEAEIVLDTENPLNEFLNVSLKLDASKASAASPAGIANGGYWGIPVKPSTTYKASFWAKGDFSGTLTLSIESTDGKTVYASSTVKKAAGDWKKYETTLRTKKVVATKDARFVLKTEKPGTIWLQNVSLFPPTYKNRENGNRIDIMEMMGAMKPKFLRFPGGNYLEGNGLNQRFNWKETIGPVEQRPGHPSPWNYWSTDGFGLLEFAMWCEELDMEPLLGVFDELCLGQGGFVPAGPALEPYVQEALEEIEYLIGDAKTTKWGAQRAKDGHPKPFKLTYVEIGNEDWERSGSYDARFAQFYDAIKKAYPKLQLISACGYEQSRNLWVKSRVPDLEDEHYYRNMEEMMLQSFKYDTYSRTNPTKVFCGEWATRVGEPTPNMAGALGDGAWMACMERNSDIVLLSCYAPLVVNVSQVRGNDRSMQWGSDLIGYDALTVYGSPSYYAQKMFSTMVGDEILTTTWQNVPTRSWVRQQGRRGGAAAPVAQAQQLPEMYFVTTRDSKSGVIYVKVVNGSSSARQVSIEIDGAPKLKATGEAVVLAGKSLDDTNSIDKPENIVPRTEKVTGVSAKFTREFPAFSVTVMKLNSK
jgi:alpha-L-arabinofuranosidase